MLARSDPHRTGFIITSKSFNTAETLANAARARDWLTAAGVTWYDTMCAVTANPEKADAAGFMDTHILPMDIGVGGRYSLWSAAGLGILVRLANNPSPHFLLAPTIWISIF